MKYSLFNKLSIAVTILGSLTFFSCGSSGGGDSEEVFEFKSSDLTNRYWYANPYLSKEYNYDDALIVYRFEGGGVLKKQDFSGRRDELVGSWSLSDNELIIEDESISATNRQEWFVQNKSTSNYLKLNSASGTREFFANIDNLNDVSADAYVVNDVRVVNNSNESAYRMEYVVFGEKLSQVSVLPDANTTIQLEDFKDYQGKKVYLLQEQDRANYFDQFMGGQKIKFYLQTDSGDKYKLEDQLYDGDIKALDNISITATHASGSGNVTIDWKAVDEDEIYYYVEILDKNKNEYAPKFRSTRQPATAGEDKSLVIDNSVAYELNQLAELPVGEDYFVKITGIKYEDGIDANNSSNKEMNIQAMTRFVFKAGQW